MSINPGTDVLFKGFSKLNSEQRFLRLIEMGALSAQDVKNLKCSAGFPIELGENFIENVIGFFQIPMGVATNFRIDGRDLVIPMAVEETSIIAAASKTARWIREQGEINTETLSQTMIGQIQIAHPKNLEDTIASIKRNKEYLMHQANEGIASGFFKRGGGVKDIQIRQIDTHNGQVMLVIHCYVDPCDAMGANMVTQICEFLKPTVEQLTNETVTMCILSNLSDQKLTKALVTLNNVESDLGMRIETASRFAETDPYRATTHNKGVLNGIDPIALATGNDWRAIEAAIHAYAARDGQYRAIATWRFNKTKKQLDGELIAPIPVGIVGGVTKLHPTAQVALNMMHLKSANELARIMAAVGLVQNLGALTALTTVGLIEGHMKLHIRNLSMSAGANDTEMPLLQKKLEELLQLRKNITLTNAIEALKELRKTHCASAIK